MAKSILLFLNQQNDKQLTKAQRDGYYYSGIFKASWHTERLTSVTIIRWEIFPVLVILGVHSCVLINL